MRTIAERLLFGETAPTELWVFDGASDIAICIDEINCPCDADRSALGIDEDLSVLAHQLTLSRGNREVPASEMGVATSTLSLIRSDEYAHV